MLLPCASVWGQKAIYACWIFKIARVKTILCLRFLNRMILLRNKIFLAFKFCKFLVFVRLVFIDTDNQERSADFHPVYLVKNCITSVMHTCRHSCLTAQNLILSSGCTFWCLGVGYFLTPTTNSLIPRTPAVCLTTQCSFDTHYLEGVEEG